MPPLEYGAQRLSLLLIAMDQLQLLRYMMHGGQLESCKDCE